MLFTLDASDQLPDITGRTALAVRPDVVNAKYHVITNATYNRDPVPAKFKHITNIDTCTLLCCDYSTLWEALHVNIRGRISFRFARIKIDFKVSIITHFNGEIDSHIWMLRESLRESILGFSPNF